MKNKKITNRLKFTLIGIIILLGFAGIVYSTTNYLDKGHLAQFIKAGTFGDDSTDIYSFNSLLDLGNFYLDDLPTCDSSLEGNTIYYVTGKEPATCNGSKWIGWISNEDIEGTTPSCSGIAESYECFIETSGDLATYEGVWAYDNCGPLSEVENCLAQNLICYQNIYCSNWDEESGTCLDWEITGNASCIDMNFEHGGGVAAK